MTAWAIEYWQLPIVRFGVHGQLVVRDADGRIVRSYEGLATARDGRIKPIGYLPSDRIRAYVRAGLPWTTLTEARHVRQRLFSGSEGELLLRLSTADAAAASINARNFAYPLFGLLGARTNSNAVVSTLADVMGIAPPRPQGFAPGHGVMLLDEAARMALRQNASVSTSDSPCAA